MRDDIQYIVRLLTNYNIKKYKILVEILKLEEIYWDNLRRKKNFDFTSITEQVHQFIDSINLIDFEISGLRDKFCTITGIEYGSFEKFISQRDEIEFKKLDSLKNDIFKILKNISKIKCQSIEEMSVQSSELASLIRELSIIQNLCLSYDTKDPQFS